VTTRRDFMKQVGGGVTGGAQLRLLPIGGAALLSPERAFAYAPLWRL
jgi:hypothetical protein